MDDEEELERVPKHLAVHLGGGGGDEKAEECGEDDAERSGNNLTEEGSVGVFGISSPVWLRD